jgi:hypothetical protein
MQEMLTRRGKWRPDHTSGFSVNLKQSVQALGVSCRYPPGLSVAGVRDECTSGSVREDQNDWVWTVKIDRTQDAVKLSSSVGWKTWRLDFFIKLVSPMSVSWRVVRNLG